MTDLDVIRKNHKFVWDESTAADSWLLIFYSFLFKFGQINFSISFIYECYLSGINNSIIISRSDN